MPCSLFPIQLHGAEHYRLCFDELSSQGGMGLWQVDAACREQYTIYLSVFGLLMMILMSIDLEEQKRIQSVFSMLAMVTIGVMVITLVVAMAIEPYDRGDVRSKTHISGDVPIWFDPEGYRNTFSCFVFSQLCHHGVPTLIHIMPGRWRARCYAVFGSALLTTGSAYCFLGSLAALYFGQKTKSVITLNWQDYTAENNVHKWLGKGISVLVRIFPALTVAATFPLNGLTLANTISQQRWTR
eukprot:scaffold3181_cov389-Prasinococcus_capsulatus_cf.AAC.4